MANNSANVVYGKPGGGIFTAPLGTAFPDDATEQLGSGFGDSLGWVSADGVTNAEERETNSLRGWGGGEIRKIMVSREETFTFTLLETTAEKVLVEVFGEDNVTVDGDGNIRVAHTSQELPRKVWVFELLDGDNVRRITVPIGQITEVGERVFQDGEPIGYPVTLSCYEDEDGATVYEDIAAVDGD